MAKEVWDTIIIGAGCAGLGAAVYCGRFLMKTLVLGEIVGGTIITTDTVENYPGYKKISGMELAEKLEEHAREYKSVTIKEEKVLNVEKDGNNFRIVSEENEYTGKTIIIASGTEVRKLNAAGEKELANKGVHYCALCDGAIYYDKTVAVIGGSDSAAKDALLLAQWAKKVYLIYRGPTIRPEPVNYQKVISNKKIEIITKTNVTRINGKNAVDSVEIDNPYKGKEKIELDAVFIAIGHLPLTDFTKNIGVKTNEKGEILIDRKSRTNIPGVFTAGDVSDTEFKQAITGVGEGVHAAYSAYQHLNTGKAIMPAGNSN